MWALFVSLLQGQNPPSLKGRVTDPSGAVVQDATVRLQPASGREQRTKTNESGVYEFRNLRPGPHRVTVEQAGFAPYLVEAVGITGASTLDIQLVIAAQAEKVTVAEGERTVTTDPLDNAGAIVIREQDLKTFSDDPDQLAEELQALAGPGAGPNGGQIYIDGFTGGRMPPKSSIREIRINRNPYSAEFDRIGFGRIEILTKPGSDKFRGDLFAGFSDESMNSRNPFAPNRAPYQSRMFGGRISGPLNKRASFGLDIEGRSVDENAVINATILNSSLQAESFQRAVVTPQLFLNISPRIDFQINEKNTLVGRYSYSPRRSDNRGVGEFSLLSRAYDTRDTDQSVQLTETAVLSARAINEVRFQFQRSNLRQTGDNSLPAINVLDAFNGGGPQVGLTDQRVNRYELHNAVSYALGAHTVKFGGRLRVGSIDDITPSNFGGTYTFAGGLAPSLAEGDTGQIQITSLERYRRTLLFLGMGMTPAQIRALGGGASQLTINGGNPRASVNQTDAGLFATWDWRVKPSLTFSGGLRWEDQTNISNHNNFAPRLGLAWAMDGGNGRAARTVLRLGSGIFYDRVDDTLTLQAIRFNGVNQLSYIVQNPDSFPNVPTIDQLSPFRNVQTVRSLAGDIRAGYLIQTSAGVERQLPRNTTVAVNYIFSRGVNLLRARNINTPLPGGARPYGDTGNLFLYESTGFSRQNQIMTNFNTRFSRYISLFGFYLLNYARSDTDGGSSSPADPYNLSTEWGPSRMDTRHRVVMGGSINTWWGISLNPFVIASTGSPFNIVTGRDSNNDSLFLDRPSFASDLTAPGVVLTRWGNFQLNPGPNDTIIPRNYGRGPGLFMLNLRLGKTWSFGGNSERAAGPEGPMGPPPGGGLGGPGGGGGRGGPGGRGGGPGMGPGGPGGPGGRFGAASGKRYNLTFSIQARNLLNNVNLASPTGNLSSPLFGQSTQLGGMFGGGPGGGGPGGGGGAAANRRLEASLRFSF